MSLLELIHDSKDFLCSIFMILINLWFLWNVMATLLSFRLFLRRQKHSTVNTIYWLVCDTINKPTVKIFRVTGSLTLIKDSFQESIGVSELKMVLHYQIFLVPRYLFQTIAR